VGWVYFGATFYWIMLPHSMAILGWIALTSYLALYVVFFVGLSRLAIHRLRISPILAAPVVWTGLEIIRAHLLSGFLMAALGHTQHRWLSVIQISDLVGAYGVSFLVMFVAACLARALPYNGEGLKIWPLLPAGLAVFAAVLYGQLRLQHELGPAGPRIALIQGSIDTQFDVDPVEMNRRIDTQYLQLTREALKSHPDLDLVIWPESMCTIPLITIDEGAWLPAEITARWSVLDSAEASRLEAEQRLPPQLYALAEQTQRQFGQLVHAMAANGELGNRSPPRLLIGVTGQHYGAGQMKSYNSSVYLGDGGEILGRYDKMHLVIFGEYIPLGDIFPGLYGFTPLVSGLTAGNEAVSYDVAGYRLTPNICYETVLPHVIRRQLVMLDDREPDVLVSQTNDGWFLGSAALDMHLTCGVFRAIEFRKPLLIAANTGFSAAINADGLVERRGRRRALDILVVQPRLDARMSLYLLAGDWFAWSCAACCMGLLFFSIFEKIRGWNSGEQSSRG
jgi:apolipoprotein N-acyltransferase